MELQPTVHRIHLGMQIIHFPMGKHCIFGLIYTTDNFGLFSDT